MNLRKLEELNNHYVVNVIQEATQLCKPAKVTVITDSKEDINYVKELALINGEEKKLKMEGHTIHFDGYYDQARDKTNTKYLSGLKSNGTLTPLNRYTSAFGAKNNPISFHNGPNFISTT